MLDSLFASDVIKGSLRINQDVLTSLKPYFTCLFFIFNYIWEGGEEPSSSFDP